MSAQTSLSANALSFTDVDNNTSTIEYNDDNITYNSTLTLSSGVTSTGVVRIKAGSDYNILSDFDTLISTNLHLNDNSLENDPEPKVTLVAPSLESDTTLTLPASQGASSQFLQLDTGSQTKWNFVSSASSPELAWEFGTVAQLWSVCNGDPFSDISSPTVGYQTSAPLLTIGRDSATNTTNNHTPPFYTTAEGVHNWALQILTSAANKQAAIWWDQSVASTNWDFRACLRIVDASTWGDSFCFFGNDSRTGETMVTTSGGQASGGRAQDSQGICVQVYTGAVPNQVRFWENGVQKASYTAGAKTFSDVYRMFRVQRKDRVIRYEMFPGGDTSASTNSHHFVVEYTLTDGYEPSGVRWGISGHCSSAANLSVKTSYFEVRTFDE